MNDETATTDTPWDLFLSYSRADTDAVIAIRSILEARGIRTFFDRDQLLAGMPWPQALEKGLRGVKGVAVFLGPSGMGLWQKREMAFALDRQVAEERSQRGFPVIPVLLPGADITPGFLFLNTWIDLRADPTDPDGLDALIRAARGEAPQDGPDEPSNLCPYQGLRPFQEESAAFFCGREAFSLRIKEILLQRGFVVVMGSSGSGKSSIVQAGVLPLLRRQRPPDATWDAVRFIPGTRPFEHLATALLPLLAPELGEAKMLAQIGQLTQLLKEGKTLLSDVVERILAKSGGTDRLLLVADQFEEVFTQCADQERQQFLELLFQNGDGPSRLNIIITMRGRFYHRLTAANRVVSDRLENTIVNLGPMTRVELQKAIVEPAKRLGVRFEPGLPKRILDDVGDEPGNLPLMEFALTELWARREGRAMTHAAYEQIGGVEGAIVQRAESVFEGFTPSQQETAKRILLRLVWVGSSGVDSLEARQRIPWDEIYGEARQIIQTLADARLLVIGQEGVDGNQTVEVAHEALIRKWPRMRTWLDEDQEFLLWRRRLQGAKGIWEHDPTDETTLLGGAPLLEAERWFDLRRDNLGPEDTAFIQKSLDVDRHNRQAVSRRRRRSLALAANLALIFMCLAGIARWQSLIALSEQLAATARSQLHNDPERSLMLGIEAVKIQPTEAAVDVLKKALQNSLLITLDDKLDFLTRVMFNPTGDIVLAIGKDRRVRAWKWDGHHLIDHHIKSEKLRDPINGLALNPDWTLVLASNPDYSVSLLEARTGRLLGNLKGHTGLLVTGAFSPDGQRVVTASEDGSARVWDVQNFSTLIVLRGHTDRLTDAAFSPDGQRIVTASLDETAIIWDAQSGQELFRLKGHQSTVNSARFSHDGQKIVTASGDNSAMVWDALTGKPTAHLENHTDSLTYADFSPTDADLILTISRDRTGKVWKSPSSEHWDWHVINELHGHQDILTAAAFNPDGRFIATVSRDRSIRIWQTLSEHGRLAYFGHTGAVHEARFNPVGGQWVISASSDNTARLWNLADPKTNLVLAGHQDSLCCADFSPDGRRVITGSDDHRAKLWDADTGKLIATLLGHEDSLNSVAFDPTGQFIVTASDDYTARVWNGVTGKLIHVLDGDPSHAQAAPPSPQQGPVFSPDGKRFASLEGKRSVRVRETGSDTIIAELTNPKADYSALAFSPHGNRLATADQQGLVQLWDSQDWHTIAEFKGHEGPVNDMAFRSDGQWLATAGSDRTLRLWQAASGNHLGDPLMHNASLVQTEFSADGQTLVGITQQGEISAWNPATGERIGTVCPNCASSLGSHTKRVTSAEFSPDGQSVLTASRDGHAMLWDAATGQASRVINHNSPLVGAHFSPDGKLILTLGRDHTAKLWQNVSQDKHPLYTLEGHEDELTSGSFSADGKHIATASRDGTAKLWETATGRLLHTLKAHRDWVNSVEFSPDGTRLITAGSDANAILWDTESGAIKLELRGHQQGVRRAHFNEDGTQVVTAGRDGTLRTWNLKDIEANKLCPECAGTAEEICKQAKHRAQRQFSAEDREKYHMPWFTQFMDFRCPG